MFPQTHVYFAEIVLGKLNDAVVLGSIFPDMVIGTGVPRDISHTRGRELLEFLRDSPELLDFARGNITHGVEPDGLDYYGDEKNPPYERGYCFEKGRSFIDSTVKACNIPREMGWWKAHNIIEMGIELRISSLAPYGEILRQAFANMKLVDSVSRQTGLFFGGTKHPLARRVEGFSNYIDLERSTAETLAHKYSYQMYYKHRINIDVPGVAFLIGQAAEFVENDVADFFSETAERVKNSLLKLDAL